MNHVVAIERTGPHPRADECRVQLNRILSSPDFEATDREHRFLAYIVEEALAGRGNRIKAYSIAMEVFGREETFDAQNDPIVRIAAAHLRRALERYYLTTGRCDTVVITVPKGCYIPTFVFGEQPAPIRPDEQIPMFGPGPAAAIANRADAVQLIFWRGIITGLAVATLVVVAILTLLPALANRVPTAPEVPRVLIMKLEDLSQSGSSATVANGLTQEIVTQLSKFRDIVVLQAANGGTTLDPPPRFILAGSVALSDDDFHLRIRFVNQETGLVLWANTFDGPLRASELVHAQSDIAEKVAISLAQTYGVIFQNDVSRISSQPPDDWAAYSCTLSYYSYRMSMDQIAQPKVRRCLEQSVERFPNYSTAWALLAQIELEQIRFTLPYDPVKTAPALEQAMANARRAIELDPLNTRALQAEMFALFFTKQFEAGKKVGDRALELNPNDTELRGEYGYRLALSGDWKRGCDFLREAREKNPGADGYYQSGLALCGLFGKDPENAVMWITKTKVPQHAIYHLIAAAVFGNAGMAAQGRKELDWLCLNRPVLIKRVREEVAARIGREQDIQLFLLSLEKAGLSMQQPEMSCRAASASNPLVPSVSGVWTAPSGSVRD